MAEQFYTILTTIGKAKIANANALGTKLNITKLQVGDGGGSYYNPTEDQTELKHKVWEGNISSITIDENNKNWIVIEILLPGDIGGFTIREAGIFDNENNLIAIGKYPETYKPVTSEGSLKDLKIKMILEVSNTANVTLKVDPTVILATHKDIENLKIELNEAIKNANNFAKKTYLELKQLKDLKKLNPNTRYILTDYRTKYVQPRTKVLKEMDTEELILTPLDGENFQPVVYSLKYPQDVIYYDFNNNICEDNKTARNGFINRRIDIIKCNDFPCDWRTILWARWCPDEKQYYLKDKLVDYEVWTSGNAKLGVLYKSNNDLYIAKNTNIPTSPTDEKVFEKTGWNVEIANLIKDQLVIANNIKLKLGKFKEKLTFGENCYNNILINRNTLHETVLGNDCFYNFFKNGCDSNSLGNSCYYNNFGNNCYSNILLTGCVSNSFNNNCFYNVIENDCGYNSFGNGCDNNVLKNGCNNNSFGNGCDSNVLLEKCFYNSFANSCCSNKLGSNCTSNNFKNVCSVNFLGNNCTDNNFDNDCIGNKFNNNCSNIHVNFLQTKDLTNIDIYNKQYPITINRKSDGIFVYSYLDNNSNIIFKDIP